MKHPKNEVLDTNRRRCGRPLQVCLADLGNARFVECEACAAKPPFNTRQVFVVFVAGAVHSHAVGKAR
jgi:hypothetical protein